MAIGPAALTAMTRSLWESDGLPSTMQEQLKAVFIADPDRLMRLSLDLFHCIVTGGAGHLTGHDVGARADVFDTPQIFAGMAPTPDPFGLRRPPAGTE